MVCYSNSYKNTCGKVVTGVSAIMFLMGLLVIAFGAMQMGAIPGGNKFQGKIPDMSSFSPAIIFLGVISIVIGVLGCCLRCHKNCCLATSFIGLAGVIGLVCLIFGFLVIGDRKYVNQAVNFVCTGVTDDL